MSLNSQLSDYKDRLFQKQTQVVVRVAFLLKQKGWTRRKLAEAMKIKEASLSRMLASIGANMTLETISKMEVALESDLLVSPQVFEHRFVEDESYRNYLLGFVRPTSGSSGADYDSVMVRE